jgi:hypothetical protein
MTSVFEVFSRVCQRTRAIVKLDVDRIAEACLPDSACSLSV